MKSRLFYYISIGVIFGFVDWFVQEAIGWLSSINFFPDTPLIVPVILFLIYGVWLIPAFFVARHAAQISNWFAAVSTSLMWVAAVLFYYVAYGVGLLFYGLPYMDHLLWANRNTPAFSEGWQTQFEPLLLAQAVDWLPVAILGGLIVGFVIAVMLNRRVALLTT